MARIIVGSYVVRFAVGGYLSWVLQWLVGFARLGHEVYFVEKAAWRRACYDRAHDTMGDDPAYGIAALSTLLARFGLGDRWCFVDIQGGYHGMSRRDIEAVFATADLFVDMGTHGHWLPEAEQTPVTVLIDGDPGYTQMMAIEKGGPLGDYDHYFTVGQNVGSTSSTVPTAGRSWRTVFDPVVIDLFPVQPVPPGAPFTTIMAWESYRPIRHEGRLYGAKKYEFMKFLDLPRRTDAPLELALRGKAPTERLLGAGWRLRDAIAAAPDWDGFRAYLAGSRGEFTVSKNYYVATHSGFFSERSAAYLASGRPVVMQDTGVSAYLPCGRGLFAVRTVDEAADAIEQVCRNHEQHARWARDLAVEYLSTSRVLPRLLDQLGVPGQVDAVAE